MSGRRILAVICCLAAPAWAQRAPDTTNCVGVSREANIDRPLDRLVVERADLERRGWTRVSEALQQSTWALASIDGYTFDASADGFPLARLSAAGQPDWLVLVDGQRVPIRIAGTRFLELLPVTIAQVERIVITRAPTLVNGRIASRGVIDVRTRHARTGALRATYAIGNERGDPGPYRYTELATPNVERLGPDAMVALFGAYGPADGQLGARYSTLNVTDEALLPRLDPDIGLSGRALQQTVESIAARTGFEHRCGRHDLIAGISRFTGLLYHPQRDDWTRTTLAHIGATGTAPLGARFQLRYAIIGDRLEVDTLPPLPLATLPHRRGTLFAHGEIARVVGATELALLASASEWSIATDRRSDSRSDLSLATALRHRAPRTQVELVVGGEWSGGAGAPQVLGTLVTQVGSRTSLLLSAGRDARPLDGEEWSEAMAPITAQALTERAPSSVISWAGVGLRLSGERVVVEVEGDWRRAGQWRVRDFADVVAGDIDAFDLHLRGETLLGPARAALAYRVRHLSSPVELVRRALDATPRHSATATLGSGRLAGNFRLSGALTLRSAATWPIPSPDSSVREAPLAPLARLDATIEKWLWHDRARLFIAARNLFDREERYHPEGAHFALRVHLGLDLDLRRPP